MKHVVAPVEHSPLGASGAPRWINCPGSVKASKGLPNKETVFAAEGTAAHWLADTCFKIGYKAEKFIGDVIEVGSFSFGVTAEFAASVQEFLDWCAEVPTDATISEAKIPYERYVPGGFCWVDRAMIKDGVCTIRDLKFGKGVQVWAKDNEQLLVQAVGILETYPFDEIVEFRLGIHQPRLDHKDEWTAPASYVRKWIGETLEPAIKDVAAGSKFAAGEWCQFCPKRQTCAVRANVGLENIFGDLDAPAASTPVSIDMPPERKAQILPLIPIIKGWLSDFEKGAVADLIAGKTLGGWKLVEGRSNRKWADPDKVASRVSPEDAFEKSLRSPAQLEKILGKPKFAKVLAELVIKPPGKPKLAGPDDPRTPMTNLSEASFTDLDEE